MQNYNNAPNFFQQVMYWKNQGKTPNEVMQILFQQNPNLQQEAMKLKNMANGRNPKDFVMQLAKQNGATEQDLQMIGRIMGG